MIFFMVYSFSFIFLSNFFSLKNGAPWRCLSHFFKLVKTKTYSFQFSRPMTKEICDNEQVVFLLDLPELALDLILERLEPKTLCKMNGVCSYFRDKCVSDYLWKRHMNKKWGRLIGESANREWQGHITSARKSTDFKNKKQKTLFGYASNFWPLCKDKMGSVFSPLPKDSIMAWYLALETGKFWFPAQVYNRQVQNGNIGFMLSCYDAELGYDFVTDSFKARYSPKGRSTVEYDIEWDRVRPPSVDTHSCALHTSGCLDDLAPGDHIEIQWRKNKDFAYGWWYGVVAHLESCDGNKTHCPCYNDETMILEFKQYTPASRWRLTRINRKGHREIGNGIDGFYGGIRKLYRDEEISIWKKFWGTYALE